MSSILRCDSLAELYILHLSFSTGIIHILVIPLRKNISYIVIVLDICIPGVVIPLRNYISYISAPIYAFFEQL